VRKMRERNACDMGPPARAKAPLKLPSFLELPLK